MTTGGALEAIVLAAGAGARFGGKKLTASWRGRPLIEGALASAFAAPARGVWVVTGADDGVGRAARAFAASVGTADRLRLVHAQAHAEGMAASLRAAIASLPTDAAGVFVFLGDMPLVPAGILPDLAAALVAGADAAAPAFEGQRGHPVLFGRALFGDLTGLTGDRGAREILDRLGERLTLIETADPGVLYDVDLPGQG